MSHQITFPQKIMSKKFLQKKVSNLSNAHQRKKEKEIFIQ